MADLGAEAPELGVEWNCDDGAIHDFWAWKLLKNRRPDDDDHEGWMALMVDFDGERGQ